ncbi:hypothetical protein [uncultured Methylibium sp.]|uniref:hypothetical protein n=1 Tax=uncultured Methylibium sp. TaxID=381093 RepID=UPI0025D32347|nr:hypothetical protein [uncultured Methylibium sp.]
MQRHVIVIRPDAPAKPAPGAACNGCGVCCLAEPCPAAMLLTLRRRGACRLLEWSDAQRRYRCGLLTGARRPGGPAIWARWLQRRASRWIAAGSGCDAHLEVEAAAPG